MLSAKLSSMFHFCVHISEAWYSPNTAFPDVLNFTIMSCKISISVLFYFGFLSYLIENSEISTYCVNSFIYVWRVTFFCHICLRLPQKARYDQQIRSQTLQAFRLTPFRKVGLPETASYSLSGSFLVIGILLTFSSPLQKHIQCRTYALYYLLEGLILLLWDLHCWRTSWWISKRYNQRLFEKSTNAERFCLHWIWSKNVVNLDKTVNT